MRNWQQGFSLIELLIVVAIILNSDHCLYLDPEPPSLENVGQ